MCLFWHRKCTIPVLIRHVKEWIHLILNAMGVYYVLDYLVSGFVCRQVFRTEHNVSEPGCIRNFLFMLDKLQKPGNMIYVPRWYWLCNFVPSATVVVYCRILIRTVTYGEKKGFYIMRLIWRPLKFKWKIWQFSSVARTTLPLIHCHTL